MKLLIAQLNPTIGAFNGNILKIVSSLDHARALGCDLVIFSELLICGYPPEDLLVLPTFVDACEQALQAVVQATKGIAAVIGTIRCSGPKAEKRLHNSAAVISDGELIGYQDKRLLPTYDVFDERRYFEPGTTSSTWEIAGHTIGITICEDLWQPADQTISTDYQCDPVAELINKSPDLMVTISASPYSYEKNPIRSEVVARTARQLGCPVVFCNQVGGNDSLIFDGNSLVADRAGQIVHQSLSFQEDLTTVDLSLLGSPISMEADPTAELFSALVCGVRDYFQKSGCQAAHIGLSGGIDSSLVACIAKEALGAENISGVLMPSRYSSEHSVTDAQALADALGIHTITIPIEEPFEVFERLLLPYFQGKPADATEENLQARTRGMILMALSNKHGSIVLATGNKSEMAMGYATLYGDMCGGLAVINDVSKGQVYALCRWLKKQGVGIPDNVFTKPPSAELAPGQLDSDTLPDYAIIDRVLVDYVEGHIPPGDIAKQRHLSLDLVQDLVTKIHKNEYKRRQAAPGLRVTEKAFSIGHRFPIVQDWH